MVCVHSVTYNHIRFIKDALDGFCSQRTSFPFVCVIIDDASVDGTKEFIKQYLTDSFEMRGTDIEESSETNDYSFYFAQHKTNTNCYFAVYLLKYNHYQIRKLKTIYLDKWSQLSNYIALCEGDDYWIIPEKLQRQVDFLENNRDYTMTCSRSFLYSVNGQKIVGENYCYSHSKKVSLKDIIYRRGLYISTCSLLYRKSVTDNKPEYWINSLVGDYPLQIACALKGNVWYNNEAMTVYRIDNPNSWVGMKNWYDGGADSVILNIIRSGVQMLKGFAKDYPQNEKLFKNKIAEEINRFVPSRKHSRQVISAYLSCFDEEIKDYPLKWRIDLLFRKCRVPYIRTIYQYLFTRQFLPHNKLYNQK